MHIVNISAPLIFQSLADETRLRILKLFVTTKEEACLCELVDALHEPSYKLSKHLKLLKQAGLLSAEKDGKWVYHRLVSSPGFLRKLYAAIEALSDEKNQFTKDLKRFQRRLSLREDGKCRVGIQVSEFAALS